MNKSTYILRNKFGVSVFHAEGRTLFSVPTEALKQTILGNSDIYHDVSMLMLSVECNERMANYE